MIVILGRHNDIVDSIPMHIKYPFPALSYNSIIIQLAEKNIIDQCVGFSHKSKVVAAIGDKYYTINPEKEHLYLKEYTRKINMSSYQKVKTERFNLIITRVKRNSDL